MSPEIRSKFVELLVLCEQHLDGETTSLKFELSENTYSIDFRFENSILTVDQQIEQIFNEFKGKRGWAIEAAKRVDMTANAVRVRHSRLRSKKV